MNRVVVDNGKNPVFNGGCGYYFGISAVVLFV
jgi:hypothetical protein